MSDNNPGNDPGDDKVKALRDMGHDEAADDLAMLLEDDARQAKAREQAQEEAQRKYRSHRFELMPGFGADSQAQSDGAAILDALRRSGVGQGHGSFPLLWNLDKKGGH